jgi:hypothetical protein
MNKHLCGVVLASALLAAGAANAAPATIGGEPALAFAAFVGAYSPSLSAAQKLVLRRFLGGQTSFASSNATISFQIAAVHCQRGDVELQEHSCQITYGSAVTSLKGEEGAAILGAMAMGGVFADGAAGTIHYDMTAVTCTLNVAELKSPDGGGASCTYTAQ